MTAALATSTATSAGDLSVPAIVPLEVSSEVDRFIKQFLDAGPEKQARMLAALRAVNDLACPSTTFQVAYEGRYSKLEVRLGVLGAREVQFTLKGGSGNLCLARDEINQALKGVANYPQGGFNVHLAENNDLPKGKGDIVTTYTPVLKDSGNRTRYGADPRTSHAALLQKLGLGFVNTDLHQLATGAFRLFAGFPEDTREIGTPRDKGDLNEGMAVRTEKGPRSVAVNSHVHGVRDTNWLDHHADVFLVVAGALLPGI